ncbi:MAG: T9SS type A sorting domain-containing protein [bacterium]
MKSKICLLTFFLIVLISHPTQAHVELNYPEGGETFIAGDTITIKWTEVQSHVTLNWEIWFSPDASNTWIEVSNNIPISAREYEWIIPNMKTEKGRIRVVQHNDEEQDYEDVSANFTIELPQSTPENIPWISGLTLLPNPAKDACKISFNLLKPGKMEILVFEQDGKLKDHHSCPRLNAGEQQMSISVNQWPAGTYLLQVRSERAVLTRKLIVSR